MTKKILSVIAGFSASVLLLTIFVQINVHFTDQALFAKYTAEQIRNDLGKDPFQIVVNTVWQFDYIFDPLIAMITSLVVTAVNKRATHFLSLISLAPFFVLVIFSSGFSLNGFILLAMYIACALVAGGAAGLLFSHRRTILPATLDAEIYNG